jgi:hypothetical protein
MDLTAAACPDARDKKLEDGPLRPPQGRGYNVTTVLVSTVGAPSVVGRNLSGESAQWAWGTRTAGADPVIVRGS